MTKYISYDGNNLENSIFWSVVGKCSPIAGSKLDKLLNLLNDSGKLICGRLASIILILQGVRDGCVNPVDIVVSFGTDDYVIAPNGDLYRMAPKNDDCDHLPLVEIGRKIGVDCGLAVSYHGVGTSSVNSTTSEPFGLTWRTSSSFKKKIMGE